MKDESSDSGNGLASKKVRVIRPMSTRQFNSLVSLIGRYKKEAEKAAKARAYYAACILMGSALEGAFLAMCTAREEEVEKYISGLSSKHRLRRLPVLEWTLNDLLRVATALQWLPIRPNKYSRKRLGDWGGLVQELRNLVHPGMHVRKYPGIRLRSAHWKDAKAFFELANDSLLDLVLTDLRGAMRREGIVPRPRF